MHVAERSSRRPLPQSAQKRDPDSQSTSWTTPDDTDEPETLFASRSSPSKDVPVSEDLIRAALKNALASAEFQSAPQLRAFLEFVVEATLSKNRGKIKGYTIALEALGRSEDFNPVTDPIVRVEAARLRRRLDKYYEGSGTVDPVRITIPKGSYAPRFSQRAVSPVKEISPDREKPEDFGFDAEDLLLEKTAQFSLPDYAPGKDEVPFLSGLSSQLPEPGIDEDISSGNVTLSANASQSGSFFSQVADVRNLSRHRLPLPFVILLSLGCFAAGYLAAMP
ncbi:hypothetical protein ABLO27_09340 [Roseibium sp. SCPC15]|uniref:hypothetical protein n=1 Tax=Roseibium sp. SCP15 TaxID=3141376 RepID=UPI00333D091C